MRLVAERDLGGLLQRQCGLQVGEVRGDRAQAAVDDGDRPGVTTTESAELRDAKKRIRLLEQENEVLRRAAAYLGQASLPKS